MAESPLLALAAKAIDEKKAENIVILNMKGISSIADYFIICHGNSDKQVKAIADGLKEELYKRGYEVKRIEGYDHARWILIDLGDTIVHVFHKEERSYYNLEKLWGDVPTIELERLLAKET